MAISYNKLWKLLVDKKMSKADLRCAALNANIGDIMDFVSEDQ